MLVGYVLEIHRAEDAEVGSTATAAPRRSIARARNKWYPHRSAMDVRVIPSGWRTNSPAAIPARYSNDELAPTARATSIDSIPDAKAALIAARSSPVECRYAAATGQVRECADGHSQ